MFVIGKASEEEIAEMIEQGWEVEEVNQDFFNRAIDPNYGHAPNPPSSEPNPDQKDYERLVCVYTDQDISKQLTQWRNEELAWLKMRYAEDLEKMRREKLQDLYENMQMADGCPVVETEGVSIDGNHYIQNFYFEEGIAGEDSKYGTFHVYFKDKTAEVIEYRAGEEVPLKA